MLAIAKDRPQKHTEFSKYMEMYYQTKMKPVFDTLQGTCLQSGMNPKKRINYVKNFQKQALMQELQDLRATIQAMCEDKYQQVLVDLGVRTAWNRTAKDYHA
jgi:hypothetical protein